MIGKGIKKIFFGFLFVIFSSQNIIDASPPSRRPSISLFQRVEEGGLNSYCDPFSQCKVKNSYCRDNRCCCLPYFAQHNSSTCLKATLLGFECRTDAQCSLLIPNSGCVRGVCECSTGFVSYRRNTCLPPAKIGDVCFSDQHCRLGDRRSHCKYMIPGVLGRCQCSTSTKQLGSYCSPTKVRVGSPCLSDTDCRSVKYSFCQPKRDGSSVCSCYGAFTPSVKRDKCLATFKGTGIWPVSLGLPCVSHAQCQAADPGSQCTNGVCDCMMNNNTCGATITGCSDGTFQCRASGKCISWFFVCDGKPDCSDGSDEECRKGWCPDQSFVCGDGACMSLAKLCDGRRDCSDGSDEKGCKGNTASCPSHTFPCSDGSSCVPEHDFCNAVVTCPDKSDEPEPACRLEYAPSTYCPFRCGNGRCRSTAIVCSGIDGCGDNSDEGHCQVCKCPVP